jgi:glycosyltransferase involved in cell wall biosynthesis
MRECRSFRMLENQNQMGITMKISGIVITFNEEMNIRRCLTSLGKVCDELIVVDSFSTDQTVEIAKELGAKVMAQKFLGYIEQKNFALKLATHEYILSLDGDEELSSPLVEEILALKKQSTPLAEGYMLPRLTQYVNQWVYHCGWYPDFKLRLAKKSLAEWSGENPHDKMILHSPIEPFFLKNHILHYSYQSITSHIQQTNRFTTIAAKASFARGVRSSLFKIITRPCLKFLRDYFYKRGFLDGRYGLIICTINALSAFLKYSKIHELQLGRNID